jgi:osmotically-inducible protein OsmY
LGVTVSVSQRTVHLEGRVATERQKRAAQGVKGIEEVRSRISIG